MGRDPRYSPFMVAIACSASVLSRKATKPYPLELPETLSQITCASLNITMFQSSMNSCSLSSHLRHGTKVGKGACKHIIIDFSSKISHKDMEMFTAGILGLLCPVELDLLMKLVRSMLVCISLSTYVIKKLVSIHFIQCTLGCSNVCEIHKTIVDTSLKITNK